MYLDKPDILPGGQFNSVRLLFSFESLWNLGYHLDNPKKKAHFMFQKYGKKLKCGTALTGCFIKPCIWLQEISCTMIPNPSIEVLKYVWPARHFLNFSEAGKAASNHSRIARWSVSPVFVGPMDGRDQRKT